MNMLKNQNFRRSLLFVLSLLQLASVGVIPKAHSDSLFLLVNLSYLALGFLSLDWRQATKNIIFATLPVVILISMLLLVTTMLHGNINDLVKTAEVSFAAWALILAVALPIFWFGFGLRFATLKFLNTRK
jgi:hypothetical protein